MNLTILDTLLSNHAVTCDVQPVIVAPDEIVHVVGAQEPVREQPDDRAQFLLNAGWLKIENVRTSLSETERANLVTAQQQTARAWQKKSASTATAAEREQVRWIVEKTRSRESKQQIAQRVWLAMVLYGMNYRGLAFDSEGQIHWKDGITGRIGLAPDATIDLAWQQESRQVYAASFRQPDGTITRGKGRHRWHVYRLTIDPAAGFLFERRAQKVHERVGLIIASETHATQPQLPRDFYGGDAFQQACIDAEDQRFEYSLVLSPEHGVISLDDIVPSDQLWDEVLEQRIWAWQLLALQRLGAYLFSSPPVKIPNVKEINWWPWLNPESVYEFTIFGAGFAVRILIDTLIRSRSRSPQSWPDIRLAEQRPGYDTGVFDDDLDFEFDMDDDLDDKESFEALLQDIDRLLEWASELVSLVSVYVAPTGEVWDIAADEALIPVRLLVGTGMNIEDFLDLLTDITLLLEQPLPFSMMINAHMLVSVLLQITHSLAHNEREPIQELVDVFPEGVLRQYIETVQQEPSLEDRLCACLTLAEQAQLIALSIPSTVSDQLLIWLQTYVSVRLRHRLMGENGEPTGRP